MPDTLNEQTLNTFLAALASSAPTPGGGSVASLSGAMAAGLVSMVCSLTIGKKQFAEIEGEVRGIQGRAEGLRRELQALAQEDMEVFGRLSAAYKLPRTTDADAASRQAAIQKVTQAAAEVPLRTAQAAVALIPLCTFLASRCSRLIVSDIGVAALLARATVQSAVLNVEINLSGLEDKIFVREARARIEDMIIGLGEEAEGILKIVRSRING
ncbi:MAG: cyclodeaminase/cyclohydrolase family protein [Chloroflexales bacterium]